MANREFPLSIVIKALDRATAPLRALAGRLRAFRRVAGLDKLGEALKGIGQSFGNVFSEAGKLVLAAGGAAAAIGLLLNQQVELGDALGNTAQRTGITVSAFSAYAYAAGKAGIEQETFTSALDTFNASLGQAKAGKGKLAGFLGTVSPRLLEQLKGAKDNAEALDLAFRAMDRVKDPSKRAALSRSFFGGAGTEITQLFPGIESIRADVKEWENLDQGGAQRFVDGAKEVDEQLDVLGGTMTVVAREAASALFPAFAKLVAIFNSFLVDNRDAIKVWAKEFGDKLLTFVTQLPEHIQALRDKFESLAGKLEAVAKPFGGVANLLGVVAGLIIGGPLLAAIGSLAVAFVSLGIAMGATPFGWLLIAITAIATAAKLIWDNWGPITGFFKGLWDGVQNMFQDFLDWLDAFFSFDRFLREVSEFWRGVADLFPKGLRDSLFGDVGKISVAGGEGDASGMASSVGAAADAAAIGAGDPVSIGVERPPFQRPMIGAAAARPVAPTASIERRETNSKVMIEVAAPRGTKVKLPRESTPDVQYKVGYLPELAK